MGLQSQFVIASDLQSLFRNKASGLPLANGVIYFWQDAFRTIPKSIFTLNGSPPDYGYTELANPLSLTAIGTLSDGNNNDIVAYWNPFDSEGNVQLYFVEVYSAGGKTSGVLQFTRQAWPNTIVDSSDIQDFTNYVPNGQFLIHNDIAATDTLDAGEVRQATTDIAQGGWTFDRPDSSTAKDLVTFEAFGSAVNNPSANPKFAVRVKCESPDSGDTFKDLRLRFNDVNKFASETQDFTFAFSGESNSSSVNVSLILIKNYGTGGDANTETTLGTFTIGSSYTISPKSFTFGTNISKTIGPDGDDFLQLALRFPLDALFDVSLTDFILAPDAITITEFPPTPNSDFLSKSIAGFMPVPAYDGSDLYLPLKLTSAGMTFDNAVVGDVVMESGFNTYTNSLSTISNRMLADGNQYETAGYSPLGIPFTRLQAKYFDGTINAPIYGTGSAFLTANISDLSPATQLRIATNTVNATTNIADGSTATTFTFATAHTGDNNGMSAARIGTATLMAVSSFTGSVPNASAGTSGFTLTEIINQNPKKHIFTVETIVATTLAGKFFTWEDPADIYYMWFTVDGVGVDPAPGGIGIQVDLKSTYTAAEVCCFVLEAMSGYQISTVVTVAAASVPAGSFFTVSTVTDGYYVWYTLDGAGTDPAPSGKTPIPVAILSADTAAQVATKTQIAINSKYFAAPNFQGVFFRAHDPDRIYDIDALTRFGKNSAYFGNEIGTLQLDQFLSHFHDYEKVQDAGAIVQGGATFGEITEQTSSTGGNETRAVNASVNVAIIY